MTADPTDTIFTITFGGTAQDSHQPLLAAAVFHSTPGSEIVAETTIGSGFAYNVYTVAFGAAWPGAQPLISVPATSSNTISVNVSSAALGGTGVLVSSGATLQLDGDPLHKNAFISVPADESVNLSGNGVGGVGALFNISGNNFLGGAVTLQASSAIGAAATTQLSMTGTVEDPTPTPIPPASVVPSNLTKVGKGAVVLASADTYTGDTTVAAGDLNIGNARSLGFNTSAEQTIAVNGASGSFTLFITGYPVAVTTGPIPVPVTANSLAAAINTMLAVAGSPGYVSAGSHGSASVAAESSGSIYVVTFGGTLAGVAVPLMVAPAGFFTGGASATIAQLLIGGESTTTVDAGASLQMQGAAVSESSLKPLVLNGAGYNNAGALESVSGGNTWGATPILLASPSSLGADAGTLAVTMPVTDNYQQQTLQFNGFTPGNTYTLSFNGVTTPTLAYTANASINATTIATNLDNLLSISQLGGTVNVTPPAVGTAYQIAFGGSMAGVNWPALTATIVAGAGNFSAVATQMLSNGYAVTKVGAATVQYASATGNTYAGLTDVHAGTLQLNDTGAVTLAGNLSGNNVVSGLTSTAQLAVGMVVTGGGIPAGTVIIAPIGPASVLLSNNATTTAANVPLTFDAAVPGNLQVGDGALVGEVQQLNLASFTLNDAFTLKYNGSAASAPIPYYTNPTYEANLIQTALTSLSTIGGLLPTAGSVTVIPDPILPNTYDITFGGSLAGVLTFTAVSAADVTHPLVTATATLQSAGAKYAPLSATALFSASNQLATTSTATVNSDGYFNLNGFSQTLTAMTINLGTASTGAGGALTLGSLTITDGFLIEPNTGSVTVAGGGLLTMTGGEVELTGAGSILTLTGNVVATSDSTAAADIFGVGTLVLSSLTPTFTVSQSGLQPSDLVVGAAIQGANGFTKAGTGRLELAAANPNYTGTTMIAAGDVQVDSVFQITLGGTFAGTDTFSLGYNNPLENGQTAPITASTVSAGTLATALENAFVALLVASFNYNPAAALAAALADIIVVPLGSSVFNVALLGVAGVDLGTLSGILVSSVAGTSNVSGVSTIGAVSVAGSATPPPAASLSGTGTVGSVSFASGTATGTIDPGVNGLSTDTGILNVVGNVNLDANDTLAVDLTHTSLSPTVVAGLDYDQLNVSGGAGLGKVNLGNAFLAGSIVPGIAVGQTFTIITATGGITTPLNGNTGASPDAQILNGNSAFIGGEKFMVTYNPTTVVLTRLLDTATITLSASPASPSMYGQDVIFTAVVTPEPGAGVIPVGTQVTFTLDEAVSGSTYTQTKTVTVAGPTFTATFDPETLFNNVWSTGSMHTVNVTFSDPNIPQSFANAVPSNSAMNPLVQQVINTNVTIGASFSPAITSTTPVYGQAVTVTATLTPPAQMPGSLPPSGTVSMFIDAGSAITQNIVNPAAGTVTFTIPAGTLATGAHTLSFVYNGDPNTNASGLFSFPLPIQKDSSTVTVSAAIAGTLAASSTLGQPVTFTADIAPALAGSPGIPGGSARFFNGPAIPANLLGVAALSNGVATFTTPNLSVLGVAHTITVVYLGDANYITSSNSTPFTVNKGPTTTTVSASPAGSVFGEPVSFTAVVAPVIAGFGTPSGTVTFYDGPVSVADQIGAAQPLVAGAATLNNYAGLLAATHTINAVYSSDANFAASSGVLTNFIVGQSSTTTAVTALPLSSVFGQSVTFKAMIGAQTPGAGVPANGDMVTFYDGAIVPADQIGVPQPLVSGVATLAYSGLDANLHNIYAVFGGDPNFAASTGTLANYAVGQSSTLTTVAVLPGASVFGQPVTFTATTTAVAPGAGTPSDGDLVSFYNGAAVAANLLGTGTTTGGVATFTTPNLPTGTLTINAVFGGDANFAASTGTVNSYAVSIAGTTTTVVAAPNSSVFGQPVMLTATVTANTPSAATVNTGTVNFYDGAALPANLLGSGTVSGGAATLTTAALPLSAGLTITAVYVLNSDFSSSTGTSPGFVVTAANTTTVVSAAPTTGDVFGESVTLTANVSANAPSGATPGAGTVDFYNGSAVAANLLGFGTVSAGVATLVTTALPVNPNLTITAVYLGTPQFNTSTGTLNNYAVGAASTTTAVSAAPTSSVFGESVTFTATVTATAPGGGVPNAGTVQFYNGAAIAPNLIGSGAVSGGAATFTTGALPVSANTTITAVYLGDGVDFLGSTGTLTNFAVTAANSSTTVSAVPTSSVFGQAVTFTATVSAVAPGAGIVSLGTVQFFNGAAIPANFIGSGSVNAGVATFTTTSLPVNASTTINAVFTGTIDFLASTGTLTNFAVGQASTATTVTAAPTSTVFGQTVTFTATISAAAPGAGTPNGGTVTFYDGAAVPANFLGTGTVNSGVAVFATATLPVNANHTITAVFAGNASFVGSTGALANFAVATASTSTVVSAAPSSGDTYGESVTLIATITSPTATVTGGTVSFYNGVAIPANLIGTSGAVASDLATFSTFALPQSAGLTITAVYSGNSNFGSSFGTLTNYAVSQALTTTALSLAPSSGDVFGQSVTMTATVTPVNPSTAPVNEGTVSFYDGTPSLANLLGTSSTVANGVATFSTGALPVGSGQTINAVYSGTAGYISSTGTQFSYAVAAAGTGTAVSAAPVSGDVFGEAVLLTATVTATSPSTAVVNSGTVSFYDGAAVAANLLGMSGTVTGGSATLSTSVLAVTNHTITAVYSGDGTDFLTSTGTLAGYGVGEAGTNTAVSAAPTSSTFGQSVTFIATVSAATPGSGTPNAGTVNFYDGAALAANLIGVGTVSGGVATASTALLSAVSHTITAVYSGDGVDFQTSTGMLTNFALAPANTSTAVSANPTSSVFGQSVTLTAAVANTSTAAPVNGGTVSFYLGSVSLANLIGTSAAVSAGSASFATTALPAGAGNNIIAVYSGATDFVTSTGTLANYAVIQANTSTAVSANPASGDIFGQTVTLSAAITNMSTAAAVNGGTVSFYDGAPVAANLLGTSGTVSAGAASITTTALSAGTHTITAVYANAANFVTSTNTLPNYAVAQANTGATVSATPASGDVYGESVTLTANLTNANSTALVNGGTVAFYDGAPVAANLIGTSGAVSGGTASFTTTALSLGSNHTITAVYAGSANFIGSTGMLTNYAVGQANTSTVVSANPSSGDVVGATVIFTAIVTATAPSTIPVNGGTVNFFDGSPVTGIFLGSSSTVVNGVATLSSAALALGASHTITAEYNGSGSYLASAGTLTGYAVAKDSTTTTVSANPASGDVFGESATFTATLTINAPGAGTPNAGTVSFYDGAAVAANFIGTGAVSAGTASISTAALSVASHTITAVYTGDNVNISGSTGTLAYTVAQAATTTTVSVAPASGDIFGQAVTLNAAISVTAPGAGAINGGTVSFYDGAPVAANLVGTSGAVVNGAASFVTTGLPAGNNHTITAVYTGVGNFAGSTGTLNPYVVAPANTGTTVSAVLASGDLFGQSVTLTAAVANTSTSAPVSGGTVSFYDGAAVLANLLGTSNPVNAGSASITTAALATGANHTITAVYSGAGNFASSSGTLNAYAVSPDNTATTVNVAPASNDVFGQTVTLSATIANTSSAAAINSGTVSFYDGAAIPANLLGTSSTVSAGAASITTAALAVGNNHTITAVYSGAADFNTSTGTLFPYAVAQAGTNTAVSAIPASGDIFGQAVTLTAAVTNASFATVVNGGTVSFYDGAPVAANLLGTSNPVSAGSASFTTTALVAGVIHTITAVYSGTGNLAGSTGTLTPYAVAQAQTATTVNAGPAGSDLFGQSLTLTATIANTSSAAPVNGGTVSFYDGSVSPANLLGTSSTVSAGTASINTTALSVGSNHTIFAVFAGAANFAGSTGSLNPYVVGEANTATSVRANPSSADVFGQTVTLTAMIANTSSAAVVSGGTVSFYDGAAIAANLLGTSTAVAGGTASITTAALTVNANHAITAVYSGDNLDFNPSSGTLNNYAVAAAGTNTSINPNPVSGAVFGEAVVLTAVVGAASPSLAVVNGGTVSFYDGAAFLGTSGVVIGGAASITTSALAVSAGHTINAIYSGDGLDFLTSTGALNSYAVGQAPTNAAVSALPSGSQVFGAPVTLTANLTAGGGSSAIVNGGTVSFYDGATVPANLLGTSSTVSGGIASITTSALAVNANHTITAVYTGAANFAGTTGTLNPYGVVQASTSTAVTSSTLGNASGAGQSVTFTATVTAASPSTATVNGGTVQFFDGANPLGIPSAVTGGVATFSTAALTQGTHSISAVYNAADTGSFSTSTSGAITQLVVNDSTTTVTATPTAAQFGQLVDFTITVSGAAGIPSGSVTLYDGAVALADQIGSPIALNGSGKATGNLANLSVGSHTLLAVYSGETNVYASSTGSDSTPIVISPTTTTTTLAASPSSTSTVPVFGQPVNLTATVTAGAGGAPTSGTVTFKDATTNTILGTMTLSGSNVVTLQTTSLSVATHSITATYGANGNFGGSTGTVSAYAVHQAGTHLTLASSVPGTSAFGQSVTFSATVNATASASTVNPTSGTVTFKNGSATLATVALNGSNVVHYTTTSLAVNASTGYTITASYAATAGYAASTSSVNQKVTATATVTSLASSQPGGSFFNQAVTFTATVSNAAGGANPTSGTVKFMDGTTLLKSVTLTATDVVSFTTSTLAVATHTISAVFTSTSTNFSGSNAAVSQTVSPAATLTTLTASSATWAVGKSITFTAKVTVPTGGTPTTRTVSFYDGATFLGNGTYSGGVYTFKTAALALGAHSITAVYNAAGAGNFATSVSAPLNQNVMYGATVAVSSSAISAASGQAVTFTATVTGVAGTPTGTVSFFDNGNPIAVGQMLTLDANGQAMLTLSTLTTGTHKITVTYSGDETYNPAATASALTETVKSGTSRLV